MKMKMQLTIAVNFISSKDTNEARAIHSKCNDIVKSSLMIKQMKLWKHFLNHIFQDIKLG